MFPSFIPPEVRGLSEATSIALAQKIESQPIVTPMGSVASTYVCQGNGNPPIVLLHGFDSSVLEFRRLLPLLAVERETWAVDLLGFGFTERLPQLAITPEAIKTHLYCFWKSAIAQPMILVGASMGGAAALDFTLTYPDAVAQLVLLDSAGLANPPVGGRFLVPPFDYWATEFLRNGRVRQQISRAAYYDKSLASPDAHLCAALHLKLPGWNRALAAFTKSGGYGGYKNKLPQIQQPTLIVWGENDRILGTKDARRFEQGIPNSQLVWIPNCGHVPHLEQPEQVAEKILSFI
ncbi:alpha/beta hydrolase [Lusitaniella coriacea LEGE 07157]|uniref:Alpha/beta hydrolase n=1 Tax=Lusitaniella coriacea LEGE 07157 TaxID=945747 RepID=A0A8J7E5A3_9CYAN|nr:alpha/beta hydrolase [Lusitaniella coriacea]MBE9118544.1 alpha/beta hydrolase [Lusitaniella coriacea LEGE 07157]